MTNRFFSQVFSALDQISRAHASDIEDIDSGVEAALDLVEGEIDDIISSLITGTTGYTAASTTSLAIGTGSKTLTITTGKSFVVGMYVRIASTATATNYMAGTITAHDSSTGAMTVSVDLINGSGTEASWNVFVSTPIPAVGKQTFPVPASGMIQRLTTGAAQGQVETSTNKVQIVTLDFDASTIEYAQFSIPMPKGWDEGTITAQFGWSHAATTVNFGVVWALQAVALSNDDPQDAAFGTAVTVNDTGGTTNDLYITAETSAMTVGGSPAESDTVIFQVYRNATDGTNDTLAVDARLQWVKIFLTMNALNDA